MTLMTTPTIRRIYWKMWDPAQGQHRQHKLKHPKPKRTGMQKMVGSPMEQQRGGALC